MEMVNKVSGYNVNQKLYRYIELDKFLHMIITGKIPLVRVTCFSDIFEATYPAKSVAKTQEYFLKRTIEILGEDFVNSHPADINTKRQNALLWRKGYFVSSWHANDYESEAMWRIYANYNKGIALETNIDKLVKNIPDDYNNQGYSHPVMFSEVSYMDYETMDEIIYKNEESYRNFFYSDCFIKRKSFEYENEVRIVTHIEIGSRYLEPIPGLPEIEPDIEGNVMFLPFDLNNVVNRIVIAPECPNYYFDIISSICDKFNINVPVETSKLVAEPIYANMMSMMP